VTRELSELLENSVQPSNMRISIPLGPIVVSVFEPHWLLKEKIRIQHEQVGTMKERTELEDISVLVEIVVATGTKSLVFNRQEQIDYLQSLLEKHPDLMSMLEEAIVCHQVFGKADNI
jgi:hypothetical protein